ncbi:unnamed protein product [Umbelopsis vinacea]
MSERGLRIRSYRSGDNEILRKMFLKAINEPGQAAFHHVLRHPTTLSIWGAGSAITLGGLALMKQPPSIKYLAAATTAWTAGWLLWLQWISAGAYYRYSIQALGEDMARIPEHYGLEAIDDSNKQNIVYAPIGPKNFFVCEDRNGAIAGFVGLDYIAGQPKRTGENEVQVIELGTSEVQYGAMKLYQKAGFKESKRVTNEVYFIDIIKYEMNLEEEYVQPDPVSHQQHVAEHAIPSA